MKRRLPHFCFIIILLAMFGHQAFATREKWVSKNLHDTIANNESIIVRDSGYVSNRLLIEANFTRKNIIAVFINEDNHQFLKTPFTAKVYVKYTLFNYDSLYNGTAVRDSFIINYDTSGSYKLRDYRIFDSIRISMVVVDSVSFNVSSWNPKPFIRITNEISVYRSYKWNNCATTYIGNLFHTIYAQSDSTNAFDGFQVEWDYGNALGADEYDLEWAWVDSSALGNYAKTEQIFKNNATRVSILTAKYIIPLIYDGGGKVYYRVRPVKVLPGGQRIEGAWSTNAPGIGLKWVAFTGFQRKLNWQGNTSFAEEGKRKTVINYFDGSLRSRQTVTKNNTDSTTVVAETFYDYQGRAAIQVLPAPTMSKLLTYSNSFNRNAANTMGYDRVDFDTLINGTACNRVADSMSSLTSGAARYYSTNNPLVSVGHHKYIPSAEGYPFTQTQYSLDNTGRIARQSGVGPQHRLGQHDTRYYYGKPSQEELYSLFGTEVGNSSHYFKNMVRDANGQYSVSYTDMHGRTIATALAGTTPANTNIVPLASNVNFPITETIIGKNSQIIEGLSIITTKGLVVPVTGDYTINYSLTPESLTLKNCDTVDICYDCLYDLNIKLINDCGDTFIDTLFTQVKVNNPSVNNGIDTTCNSTNFSFTHTFSSLPEGAYTLTKTLSIQQESLNTYRDSIFLKQNLCRTFQEFLKEEIDSIKANQPCEIITCTQCHTQLGSYNTYRNRYMTKMGIAPADSAAHGPAAYESFKSAVDICNAICADSSMPDHLTYREEMMNDLTPPSGQYANGNDNDSKNIFYKLANQPANYQNVSLVYLNEMGNRDTVVNSTGNRVTPNQLSKEEFTDMFKPSWAETLLSTHPEYCKLQKITAWQASYKYDEAFKNTVTYTDALAKGFLTPLTTDPASNSSLIAATFPTTFQNSLKNYFIEAGKDMSVWALANMMINCKTGDCNAYNHSRTTSFDITGLCTADKDLLWGTFKTLYQQVKAEQLFNVLNGSGCGPFNSYGNLYTANFVDPKTSGAPTEINKDNIGTKQLAEIADMVALNCNSYVDIWKERLVGCAYDSANWAELKVILLTICKKGGDIEHITGSSTISPDSSYLYNGFVEAVSAFNLAKEVTTNTACNGYLLANTPPPYNAPVTALVNKALLTKKPDSCTCATIVKYQTDYQANTNRVPADTSFGTYMRRLLTINITDANLTKLSLFCADTSTNCINLAPDSIIAIPPALYNCTAAVSSCITCNTMDSLYNQFTVTEFPGKIPSWSNEDTAQQSINQAFKRFLNYHTGFNYSHTDYLTFRESCGSFITDPACVSFDTILTNFKANYYRLPVNKYDANSGCDTARWVSNYGQGKLQVAPLSQIFQQGVFQPATNPTSPGLRVSSLDFYDTACFAPFTFETKVKLPRTGYAYNPYWPNPAIGYSFEVKFMYEFQGADRRARFAFDLHENATHIYYASDSGATQGPFIKNIAFNDWRNLKIEVTASRFKLYIDSLFICDVPHQVYDKFAGFYFQPYAASFNIDWLGMTDQYGQKILVEDFNQGCGTLAQLTKDPCKATCQSEFATYYNTKGGRTTNYTYLQIDSIAKNSCGSLKALNVCPQSETLSACDTLQQIRTDFDCYYQSLQDSFVNRPNAQACAQMPIIYGPVNWSPYSQFFFTDAQTRAMIYNGNWNYPAKYDSTHPTGAPTFRSARDICVTNKFAVETKVMNSRVKPNGSLGTARTTFYGLGNVGAFLGSAVLTNDATPSIWVRRTLASGATSDTTINLPGLAGIDTFFVFRYQVTPDSIKYFYNGTLLYGYKRLDNINVTKINDLTAWLENGYRKKIDYLKVYTSDFVNPVYAEHFSDANNLAYPNPSALCAPEPCNEAWVGYFNNKTQQSLTNAGIIAAYMQQCGGFSEPCVNFEPRLCGRANPLFPDVKPLVQTACSDTTELATAKAMQRFKAYTDSLINTFDSLYIKKCLAAVNLEKMTLLRPQNEYHYTLYYYDQAGNLIKTIPPKAVDDFRDSIKTAIGSNNLGTAIDSLARQVKTAIGNNADKPFAYRLPTNYRYNTFNLVTVLHTPDAGLSAFWYDVLGRLAISQNAKQALENNYSYTLYDYLSRILEVGQKRQTTAMSQTISRSNTSLLNWLNTGATVATTARQQITRTIYDLPASFAGTGLNSALFSQRYLRNRVSYAQVIDVDNTTLASLNTSSSGVYRAATFYTYDIHGNVGKLLQHYNAGPMKTAGSGSNQFKLLRYNYDLISGKVNEVTYQPSWFDAGAGAWVNYPDQFHHQYEYDAENRLVAAYTSTDSVYWEKDARYEYYRHGPLARTEIGHAKLQGLDYAYALPGWLKGLNSTRLLPGEDLGADGATAPTNGGNNVFARDAVGFGINYFLNDYAHINTASARPYAVFFAVDSNTVKANSLHNGNIMAITTKYFEKLPQPGGNLGGQLGKELTKLYKYDQLNRLKTVSTLPDHTAGNTIFLYNSGRLDETFNYDANGNIMSVQRAGMTSTTGAANMDNLTYHYTANTNRLRHVTDAIGASVFTTDLDNQVADNYRYDAIGNLIKDSAENIQKITWTVYGKIDSIYKTTGTIAYTYGPDGNRISQAVKVGANETTTVYVRDASGNVMSTYLKENSGNLTLSETHLYGSSRLGIYQPNTNVQSFTWPTPVNVTINGIAHYGKKVNFTRGKKFFEISNHLGNVLVSIADRKIPVPNPSNPALVSYYKPDIISATDYYAFGMHVPQRAFNSDRNPFGFNGQLKSMEIDPNGNSMTAEFWQYDARLGRRWNVDPKPSPWLSSYAAFANNPILITDVHGDTPVAKIGGGTMELSNDSKKTFFNGSESSLTGSNVKVKPAANTLKSFTAGDLTFVASFGSESGKFMGYRNSANLKQTFEDYYQSSIDEANYLDGVESFEKMGVWDRGLSANQAKWHLVGLSTGLTLPSALIRPLTIATTSSKVANTSIGRGVADFVRLFKPINADDAVKVLYRGTTGSEGKGNLLFLTDDATVAATYVKNGGQVMKYEITNYSIFNLQQREMLTVNPKDLHMIDGKQIYHTTYEFVGPELRQALNQIAKPNQ